MTKSSFQQELEQKAGRAILTRSVYRWESAVIIAVTLILAVLSKVGVISLPFWQWWFWLVLGALGEAGLVWSSLTDPEFRSRAVAEMFREKFNAREVRDKGLRGQVEQALEYRDRIGEVIDKSHEGVLREHLKDVSAGITDWTESVFRLAKRLDAYRADDTIRRDQQSVQPAIEQLKTRLATEDDDAVKRQISQAVAQRQIQRDNLIKLENVMERAQFQLESTLTAMGTVYSQMMLLGSRDIGAGRAQRLQQDIAGQVQALQDVVHSMDEVYQAGTGALRTGLSTADLSGSTTTGQTGQQRTAGN